MRVLGSRTSKELQEMTLIVKKCLKFLNSFLEFRYYQSMFPFRFSKKVTGTIVILDSIKMMNLIAFGKGLIRKLGLLVEVLGAGRIGCVLTSIQ